MRSNPSTALRAPMATSSIDDVDARNFNQTAEVVDDVQIGTPLDLEDNTIPRHVTHGASDQDERKPSPVAEDNLDIKATPRDEDWAFYDDKGIMLQFRSLCEPFGLDAFGMPKDAADSPLAYIEVMKDLMYEIVENRSHLPLTRAEGRAAIYKCMTDLGLIDKQVKPATTTLAYKNLRRCSRVNRKQNRARINALPREVVQLILEYIAQALPSRDDSRQKQWMIRRDDLPPLRNKTIEAVLSFAGKKHFDVVFAALGMSTAQIVDRYNNYKVFGFRNFHKIRESVIHATSSVEEIEEYVPLEIPAHATVLPSVAQMDALFEEDATNPGTDFSPTAIEIDATSVDDEAVSLLVLLDVYLILAKNRNSERLSRVEKLSIKVDSHWCRTCHGHWCHLRDKEDPDFHHNRPRDIQCTLLDLIDGLLGPRQSPEAPPENERDPIMVPLHQNIPGGHIVGLNANHLLNIGVVNQQPPANNVAGGGNQPGVPIMVPGGQWINNFHLNETYTWTPQETRKYLRKPAILAPGTFKVNHAEKKAGLKRKYGESFEQGADIQGRQAKRLKTDGSSNPVLSHVAPDSEDDDEEVEARYQQDEEIIRPRFFAIGHFDKKAFRDAADRLQVYFKFEYQWSYSRDLAHRQPTSIRNLMNARRFASRAFRHHH